MLDKKIVTVVFIGILLSIFTYQLGVKKNDPKKDIVQKEPELSCPFTVKNYPFKDFVNSQNEIEVVEKPQFIDNPKVEIVNTPFNKTEFEKGLYKGFPDETDKKGWENREFDVTGDGKNETIINADIAMNHTPHIALVVENGNIIFEGGGANVWIDKVDNGKGFLLRETVDWINKDYITTRYIYKDGGFMPIWTQKECGIVFE